MQFPRADVRVAAQHRGRGKLQYAAIAVVNVLSLAHPDRDVPAPPAQCAEQRPRDLGRAGFR